MTSLAGKIAVVTGSTRGIGRGIAIALGELGATVYVTGRSTGDGELTVEGTAEKVTAAGGEGRPVACDHGDDAAIERLFQRVGEEAGRIDILVNNVYKIPDPPAWGGGFWDHPLQVWDDQVGIGLRSHYVASWHAAPLLFASSGAAIVNISSEGGQRYIYSSSYGAGKAGLDRLTKDMAIELEPKNTAAIVVYPGGVATEFIAEASKTMEIDLSKLQTPLLVGRGVAAMLAAGDLKALSGSIQLVDDLVEQYELVDENGTRPPRQQAPLND
ncbi:MAG: SDR family NAD(P)-dependent oxidoreductase [Pseudomonadota bacterium]